ncbi:hypothetical protein Enr13x_37900 [Stieleria neptunia]|uniref:Uncharacterized protein n=1 Tax=Stieleria neptunia TaxID=2527979 RepID=A0A518HSU8_9BACT|nr:hypothetical protein [Stieleria neptunia]QDV43930.1 hypothetical protein Enr13x_37900 [Stieleria neptunia]
MSDTQPADDQDSSLSALKYPETAERYEAQPWEKVTALVVSVWVVILASLAVLGFVPEDSENAWTVLRLMLSISLGVLGAIIPGFLHVAWEKGGLAIRAGGGLAVFVLTLVVDPTVF